MSLFQLQDFPQGFVNSFGRDFDIIIGTLNTYFETAHRKFGGPFDTLYDGITRSNLAALMCEDISENIDMVLNEFRWDLKYTTEVVCELEIFSRAAKVVEDDRLTHDPLYGEITRILNNNELLRIFQDRQRQQGGGRGYHQSGPRDSRGLPAGHRGVGARANSGRGSQGYGASPRYGEAQSRTGASYREYRPEQQEVRQHRAGTRHDTPQSTTGFRGRLAHLKNGGQEQHEQREQPQQQTYQQQETTTAMANSKFTVMIGGRNRTIVRATPEALTCCGIAVPLAYNGHVEGLYIDIEDKTQHIIKHELMKNHIGEENVDYELHRVDKMFPFLIGDYDVKKKAEERKKAIQEVRDAMDNTISMFVADCDENGNTDPTTVIPNSRMMSYERSGTVREEIVTNSVEPNYSDIRRQFGYESGGDYSWNQKNALILNHTHVLEFGKNKEMYGYVEKIFAEGTDLPNRIASLIAIHESIDPVVWTTLHDLLTSEINYAMVVGAKDLTMIDSCTLDGRDLMKHIAHYTPEKRALFDAQLVKQLSKHKVDLSALTDYEQLGEFQKVITKELVVYVPRNHYELELHAPNNPFGYVEINHTHELFKALSTMVFNNEDRLIKLVTIDGHVTELRGTDASFPTLIAKTIK